MRKINIALFLLFSLTLVFPAKGQSSRPNILLIIADDVGLDYFPGYEIGDVKVHLPHLQKLMESGVRFTNFWTYPTCTPTRSSIITGKYGFRTGVLKVGDELSLNEQSLQEVLREKTSDVYSDAVIGKWHLSKDAKHPENIGVGYYAGLLSGGARDYSRWRFTSEGKTSLANTYITTKFTDLAIDWLDKQNQPWFLWLAYTAPHTPFHVPPDHLYDQRSISGDIESSEALQYQAMMQAMDTEIGRLLASIPDGELDNTIVIFIGDNGTPRQVVQDYGRRHAKGSIYQGGINTPLFIAGKGVERFNEVDHSLINSTDLFATVLDLAGAGVKEMHDSRSIAHLLKHAGNDHRDFIYSELEGRRQSGYTVRDRQYKYIRYSNGREELYDLEADPLEKNDIFARLSVDPEKQTLTSRLIEKAEEIRQLSLGTNR